MRRSRRPDRQHDRPLFDQSELAAPDHLEPGLPEADRDVVRMRLETSSGLYAQRKSRW